MNVNCAYQNNASTIHLWRNIRKLLAQRKRGSDRRCHPPHSRELRLNLLKPRHTYLGPFRLYYLRRLLGVNLLSVLAESNLQEQCAVPATFRVLSVHFRSELPTRYVHEKFALYIIHHATPAFSSSSSYFTASATSPTILPKISQLIRSLWSVDNFSKPYYPSSTSSYQTSSLLLLLPLSLSSQ